MKNIGLLAHVDAGKTTITEQMLFHTGAIRTLGNVDDGTAQTDFMEIEKKRGISVRAAVTQIHVNDTDINLIDTPGHIDFSAEVERALMVLDGVVLVVSAVEGVQAHTEMIIRALIKKKIPTVIFINKADRIGADIASVYGQIQTRLNGATCLFNNVVQTGATVAVHANDYMEELALADETLFEQYTEGNCTEQTAYLRLQELARTAAIYPVLCGSAIQDVGIDALLDAVCAFIPDSTGDENGPPAGSVFKISYDTPMGKAAYVRLYSGTLTNRDSVRNVTKGTEEKISQIRKLRGGKYIDSGVLKAGDIAAVYGLSGASAGDVLGEASLVPDSVHWVNPLLRITVRPDEEADRPRLIDALRILNEEEPVLDFYPPESGDELAINSMGIIQTEVIAQLLQERFQLAVTFGGMHVIYKETPAGTGEGFDAYTMPKPCWAVLRFAVEPLPRGSGVEYACRVAPKKLPYRYQNHVETAVHRAVKQGLCGWEVTDVRIILLDGEYHHEHTHPLDFFVATPMALAKAFQDAGMTLLEPLLSVQIDAPEQYSGKIIGEIVNVGGELDTPVLKDGQFSIQAVVPAARALNLPVQIASVSGGRAVLASSLCGYRACPPEFHAETPRRGVNPLDRSRYILWARNAIGTFGDTL